MAGRPGWPKGRCSACMDKERGAIGIRILSNAQPFFSEASCHWTFGNATSADAAMQKAALYRPWTQALVFLTTIQEAEEAILYTIAEVRKLRRHDSSGQMCKRSGYCRRALRSGVGPKTELRWQRVLNDTGENAVEEHRPQCPINADGAQCGNGVQKEDLQGVLQRYHALGPCHRSQRSLGYRAGADGSAHARGQSEGGQELG